MDIRKMLINSNQEILDFVETQQYQLSRQIMKLRYDLSLSEKEMSDILNIPFGKYLSFEYGDTNISEEEYNELYTSLKSYVDMSKQKKKLTNDHYLIKFENEEFIENKISISSEIDFSDWFDLVNPSSVIQKQAPHLAA